MNKKPKVSIIIPVYNVQNQLKKCLDSIISQTFQDYECIIVDDGSTDRSALICEQYIKKDNRMRLLHQENAGLSAARNHAMIEAKGSYISFVDSDDYLMPTYLETMLTLMKVYDAEIAKCDYFRGVLEDEDKNPKLSMLTSREFTEKLLIDQIGSQLWQYVFKASLWDDIQSPLGRYAQDMMVLHSVTNKASNIVLTSEKLYFYYIDRSNSTSNAKKNKSKGAFDRAIAFKMRYEFAVENGFDSCKAKLMINVLDYFNNGLTLMNKEQRSLERDVEDLSIFLKKHKEGWSISSVGFKHYILGCFISSFPRQYSILRRK